MFPALMLILIGAGLYFYEQSQTTAGNCCNPRGEAGTGNVQTITDMTCAITSDESTWPSGDRIYLICHAIAIAEGANISGSVPDRYNNPGDIADGATEYGTTYADGSLVTTFPDKATGWKFLHDKIANIIAGKSLVYRYSPTYTWENLASTWAGNSKDWLTNVTNVLGVDPGSTIAQYMAS